jgi:hypothetical protein
MGRVLATRSVQWEHVTREGWSRDSSVGIATGYGLDDRRGRVSNPGRVKIFLHVVQTGSRTYPTSYAMGIGGSFSGVKRPGRETDHSSPTRT